MLESKLSHIPTAPGVYIFKADGKPIYVGKASNLRNRVRSYFQAGSSDQRYFIGWLRSEANDIDTIVVDTDKEAVLLENTLIKQFRPKYNVKLRDDKEYLSLKLDTHAQWPRLEVVRKPEDKKSRYFGPYHSASSARRALRLVNRHFQLRTCTDAEMRIRKRPCLQYQIKRCPAPCVLEVDQEHYGEQVTTVSMFLDGRHDELLVALRQRMEAASDKQMYELAAMYRDQLAAVQGVVEEQKVASSQGSEQDVFGYFRQGELIQIAVLLVRNGRLSDVRRYELDSSLPDDEIVGSFVSEYYQQGSFIPKELLVPHKIETMTGLEQVLSEQRGNKVQIAAPQKGPRFRLVQMANDNAQQAFVEKEREQLAVDTRLKELQKLLRLPVVPRDIECIDISHDQGKRTVAAIVALHDGQPNRARYRSYRVRRHSGGDDYGAIHEVLSRRFSRGKKEEAWKLPDLLVVDGGKGQLNTALAAAKEVGIEGLAIVSLAKEKENTQGQRQVDRVYLPGQKNPIELRSNTAALYLLALARDEAHRSANHFRKRIANRDNFQSELDEIAGIGAKTRAKLLKELGAVQSIKSATFQQLQAAGATTVQAQRIVSHFQGSDDKIELRKAEYEAVENAFLDSEDT